MTSIRFASFDVNICKIDFSLSIFVERSTLFIDGLARRILVCTMLDDRQIGRTQWQIDDKDKPSPIRQNSVRRTETTSCSLGILRKTNDDRQQDLTFLFWLRLTRLLKISTFSEHCSLSQRENSVNALIFFFSHVTWSQQWNSRQTLDVLSDLREVTEGDAFESIAGHLIRNRRAT